MNRAVRSVFYVLAATPSVAFAQSTLETQKADSNVIAPAELGEIIVTARRRDESVQDVPAAIAVFSQDQLTAKSIASAFDLNKAVPGLSVNANSGNPALAQFAVRGKGQNYGASAGSVETYFAEVPLSAPFGMPTLPPQLFDLQSLQVLKGPQGTAFGRSTTGGAVLLVPQSPSDVFEGYARVRMGDYSNLQFETALNIPLVAEKAALRLSALHWRRDGYMKTFGGQVDSATLNSTNTVLPAQSFNNVDQTDFRATLLLTPTENFTNSTIFAWHRDRSRASAGAGLNLFGPAALPGSVEKSPGVYFSRGYGTFYLDTAVNLDKPKSSSWAAINTTTFEISEALTFKNIFGLIKAKGYDNDAADADGTVLPLVDLSLPPRPRKNRQITNEVQLQGRGPGDRLGWMVGGLADLTREPGGSDTINITSVGPGPDGLGGFFYGTSFQQNTIDSYSLFASGSYKLNEELTVSGGYRHAWNTIKAKLALVNDTTIAGSITPGTAVDRFATKQEGDTYNLDVTYQVGSRSMIYGGLRHGYKPGGFNPGQTSAALIEFGPEKVDSLYLGSKNDFTVFGGRARLNGEIFYDFYKGMQANYLTLVDSLIYTITENVAKTTFRGFDIDGSYEPVRWLTLSGAYTYIDAFNTKWDDTTLSGFTGDLSGNPVPYASKHKLYGTVRLHHYLASDRGEIVFAPSVSYQTKFYTTPTGAQLPNAQAAALGFFAGAADLPTAVAIGQFNQIAVGGVTVPAYSTVDLRAEWNSIWGSRVDAAVNVTNATDKRYLVGTTGGTLIFGAQGNGYGSPRMVSVELKAKF